MIDNKNIQLITTSKITLVARINDLELNPEGIFKLITHPVFNCTRVENITKNEALEILEEVEKGLCLYDKKRQTDVGMSIYHPEKKRIEIKYN